MAPGKARINSRIDHSSAGPQAVTFPPDSEESCFLIYPRRPVIIFCFPKMPRKPPPQQLLHFSATGTKASTGAPHPLLVVAGEAAGKHGVPQKRCSFPSHSQQHTQAKMANP